ncbi:Bypass of stop codon protein-like protein [Hapsidospora chrysogenum ATCC 11550]|uniref:Bypass of stop codon protein-like protein n=1 Tax=Hapsidospora chrysogenum (strain ATCC 11550 / CBS 779.69 / DSM 880 / IAM 14645 / JCM 23072 / IMI 49137) TaxID=857340 RepID=A0A086T4E7_HAPC1|nr:Bypass of stop codon protein-like protein [Hapsidospora chrysogenum ATCC 11550]
MSISPGHQADRDAAVGRVVNEETALLSDGPPHTPGHEADPRDEQEAWNDPPVNAYRYATVHLTLFIMGMNDACVGIEPYYDISYATVSTLFVVPFAGYVTAALLNSWIHLTVGQRGIAFLGPFCRLIGYVPMALHPPTFVILPIAMLFTGFGNGINDSAWNAWVGNLRNTNELLGLIHGSYGIGGTIAPLIASVMVTKLYLPWYTYYYVMIGVSALELVMATASFWKATGAAYRQRHKFGEGREPISTWTVLSTPIPWIVAMFLFGYVGVEVCLGGWIPTFMIDVRHADGFVAGLVVTLFWGGLTVGRVVLGFVTGRIGEKLAIVMYLALSMILQIIYWVVPSIGASIVSVSLLGFFLGPLFPAAIVAMTKLLPADQHVISIGLAAAIGGGGAAIFPFAVGLLAEEHGVGVLQPFVLALLAAITLLWLLLPGGLKKGGMERARKEGIRVGDGFSRVFGWLKG